MPRFPALPLLAACLAVAALLHGGCEGTSSGVDNPGLAITFRDGEGHPVRVSGDLDVYAHDQNPAADPRPLATLRVRNSSFATLLREDLERARGGQAAPKRAGGAGGGDAGGGSAPDPDSAIRFNLVFQGDQRTGSFASGLALRADRKGFVLAEAEVERLDLRPRALARFRARLAREAVHGDLGRVFIPGTPYLATLIDGRFEFDGLPEGIFTFRLQGGDGRVYPVRESFTQDGTASTGPEPLFTAASTPVDTADTTGGAALRVSAMGPREAVVGVVTALQADLSGADSADRRLSLLWRQIPPGLPDTAQISFPASLSARVLFRTPGAYRFEVSATLGARTSRDTLEVQAFPRREPDSIVIRSPVLGDTLVMGQPHALAWDMPVRSTVSVLWSRNNGRTWDTVVAARISGAGPDTLRWTPPAVADSTVFFLLQVRARPPDSLASGVLGHITLLPRP